MVHVYAEARAFAEPSILGERGERFFFRAIASSLIGHGDRATGAALHSTEGDTGDGERVPLVFFERTIAARDDDVRSEAVHRNRFRQTAVQIRERFFRCDEEREAVRETDANVVTLTS